MGEVRPPVFTPKPVDVSIGDASAAVAEALLLAGTLVLAAFGAVEDTFVTGVNMAISCFTSAYSLDSWVELERQL